MIIYMLYENILLSTWPWGNQGQYETMEDKRSRFWNFLVIVYLDQWIKGLNASNDVTCENISLTLTQSMARSFTRYMQGRYRPLCIVIHIAEPRLACPKECTDHDVHWWTSWGYISNPQIRYMGREWNSSGGTAYARHKCAKLRFHAMACLVFILDWHVED